ncbi:rod shape-determining protein MreD [Alistipes sp.]|uniref:rod shape-determining protein MreD n=1 Tax=Alistipes sp. TaxID=1872444 RepID=UPI0025B8235D|nr:rod shape-determining protein MreD [Alistipes sp.]
MYRTLPYLGLFATAVLLQVFLFDNLAISIYLNPLVYIVFIALLPLDTPPAAILGAGLVLGVTMDFAMGAAGINTIATLLIAFLYPTLAGMTCGRDNVREGGIPSSERLGERKFITFLVALTLVHHAVFFSLEALSWTHVLHTLTRITVSTTVSVVFIWIIARIFSAKIPTHI